MQLVKAHELNAKADSVSLVVESLIYLSFNMLILNNASLNNCRGLVPLLVDIDDGESGPAIMGGIWDVGRFVRSGLECDTTKTNGGAV